MTVYAATKHDTKSCFTHSFTETGWLGWSKQRHHAEAQFRMTGLNDAFLSCQKVDDAVRSNVKSNVSTSSSLTGYQCTSPLGLPASPTSWCTLRNYGSSRNTVISGPSRPCPVAAILPPWRSLSWWPRTSRTSLRQWRRRRNRRG